LGEKAEGFNFARRLAAYTATADDGMCPEFSTSALFTITYYLKKPAAFATGFFLVLQRRFELRLLAALWAEKPFDLNSPVGSPFAWQPPTMACVRSSPPLHFSLLLIT